jgi:cytochrome P450
MTPEEAFDAAMRYENRADPYPFFDELRKTPVARVTNGIYAVTGYQELIALAHDPRVSSDLRKSRPPIAHDGPRNCRGLRTGAELYRAGPA